MDLNPRERKIAIGTGSVLGLAAVWYVVNALYLEPRAVVARDDAKVLETIKTGNEMLAKRDRLNKDWRAMQAGGLQSDSSIAETQVLQSLFAWAQHSRLNVSIRHESDRVEGKFQLISYRTTATGGQAALAHMLWEIESASIPMRINDLQISPKRIDADELSVQFGVSTLCQLPDAEKTKIASSGAVASANARSNDER